MAAVAIVGIAALTFALTAAPVAGGAAVVGAKSLLGTLATAQTISVGGSAATATLITGGATAVGVALGTLLGSKFDKCKTDEERLAVILEEVFSLEAKLKKNPKDTETRTKLKEVLKLGLQFAC
jgi:hypothetical protein